MVELCYTCYTTPPLVAEQPLGKQPGDAFPPIFFYPVSEILKPAHHQQPDPAFVPNTHDTIKLTEIAPPSF